MNTIKSPGYFEAGYHMLGGDYVYQVKLQVLEKCSGRKAQLVTKMEWAILQRRL